jgi:hypothetical protein
LDSNGSFHSECLSHLKKDAVHDKASEGEQGDGDDDDDVHEVSVVVIQDADHGEDDSWLDDEKIH